MEIIIITENEERLNLNLIYRYKVTLHPLLNRLLDMDVIEKLSFLKKQENPESQALAKEVDLSIEILIKILDEYG